MENLTKIAIVDQDENLFHLLSKGKNPHFEFIFFDNIEKAQDYISNSKIICLLTETIISNTSTAPIVQTIKTNKKTVNYRAPIIVYSLSLIHI